MNQNLIFKARYDRSDEWKNIFREGPHPLISDSLFSLIIFIYVSVIFCYVFYAFCWREVIIEKKDERGHRTIVEDEEDAPA